MVLDKQKRLLKDLSSAGLLHGVGVTWIPEECKQLSRGARLAGGKTGIMNEEKQGNGMS